MMSELGKALSDYCMELQQIFPDHTRSLLREDQIEGKSQEEIQDMIEHEPILANSNPYILATGWWFRGVALRTSKSLPPEIAQLLKQKFESFKKT